jgi:hypothetical protein
MGSKGPKVPLELNNAGSDFHKEDILEVKVVSMMV